MKRLENGNLGVLIRTYADDFQLFEQSAPRLNRYLVNASQGMQPIRFCVVCPAQDAELFRLVLPESSKDSTWVLVPTTEYSKYGYLDQQVTKLFADRYFDPLVTDYILHWDSDMMAVDYFDVAETNGDDLNNLRILYTPFRQLQTEGPEGNPWQSMYSRLGITEYNEYMRRVPHVFPIGLYAEARRLLIDAIVATTQCERHTDPAVTIGQYFDACRHTYQVEPTQFFSEFNWLGHTLWTRHDTKQFRVNFEKVTPFDSNSLTPHHKEIAVLWSYDYQLPEGACSLGTERRILRDISRYQLGARKVGPHYVVYDDTHFAEWMRQDPQLNWCADQINQVFNGIRNSNPKSPPSQDYNVIVAGANVGPYVLRYAEHCSSVFAFEPHSEAFLCLEYNTLASPHAHKIRCYNLALGGFEAAYEFVRSRNAGASYLQGENGLMKCSPTQARERLVQVVTLDGIALPPGPLLLHLDAEGFELSILIGAYRTIMSRRPPIWIELNSITLARNHLSIKDVVSYLTDGMGYYQVTETPSVPDGIAAQYDALFLPKN